MKFRNRNRSVIIIMMIFGVSLIVSISGAVKKELNKQDNIELRENPCKSTEVNLEEQLNFKVSEDSSDNTCKMWLSAKSFEMIY